jgi:hypothetical protein
MLQLTLPAGFIAPCLPTKTDKLPSGVASFDPGTSGYTHGRLNPTERTMHNIRNALLSILTVMFGAILAVPIEAAERYIPGVYKSVPERSFSFPYGGSYLKRAKRAFGNPYVNPYYGSYYAPQYYYGNYRSPYYW